jgi:hypothetical protein
MKKDNLQFLLNLLDGFCDAVGTNSAGDCDSCCPNYHICDKEQWDKVQEDLKLYKLDSNGDDLS